MFFKTKLVAPTIEATPIPEVDGLNEIEGFGIKYSDTRYDGIIQARNMALESADAYTRASTAWEAPEVRRSILDRANALKMFAKQLDHLIQQMTAGKELDAP